MQKFLEELGLAEETAQAVLTEHEKQLRQVRLEGCLHSAVAKAGGKNAKAIGALTFTVDGTQGFAQAQVTAGGVLTDEVVPSTMQSRLFDGLYLAGEVLDVDGPCGGYNLHFAFASALTAARAIRAQLGA